MGDVSGGGRLRRSGGEPEGSGKAAKVEGGRTAGRSMPSAGMPGGGRPVGKATGVTVPSGGKATSNAPSKATPTPKAKPKASAAAPATKARPTGSKPARGDGRPRSRRVVAIVVAVAVIAVAAVAAVLVRNAMLSGDGVTNVGEPSHTVVSTESSGLVAKDGSFLAPIEDGRGETEQTLGGGSVTVSLTPAEWGFNAVASMEGVRSGWMGVVIVFDGEGRELARSGIEMPPEMGGSATAMTSIDVPEGSTATAFQVYSVDDVDGGVGAEGTPYTEEGDVTRPEPDGGEGSQGEAQPGDGGQAAGEGR